MTSITDNKSSSSSSSSTAKSVRKYGTNSRWGKNKEQSQINATGGRYIVFIAGGVSYSELKVATDSMLQHTKEIVIGGSHLISPTDFLVDIAEIEGNDTSETKL